MPLRIAIRNFGPIARGDIEIRGFTVFVGPNNSGKSVAAMLTYAVTSAAASLGYPSPLFELRRPSRESTRREVEARRRLLQAAKDLFAENPDASPRDAEVALADAAEQLGDALIETYADRLTIEIERCFGSRIEDLARVGMGAKSRTSLRVDEPRGRWHVTVHLDGPPKFKRAAGLGVAAVKETYADMERDEEAFDPGADAERFAYIVNSNVRWLLFGSFPDAGHYLPAERSGILQSHRALASFVMRQAPLVGIEEMQVPRLTGVVSDFISSLLTIQSDSVRRYGAVADELQRDVLAGVVSIKADPSGYPEVSYARGTSEFPLHRASSMVSEVAPIVLYLRYIVDDDDVLIIEEPESHLHPKSQVLVARALAKVAADDVAVVVTTHSDYLLTEINNLVRRATLELRDHRETQHALSLESSDIAAYLFQPRRGVAGTLVTAIPVTPDEGVAEDAFADVAAALYEETARLESVLAESEDVGQ